MDVSGVGALAPAVAALRDRADELVRRVVAGDASALTHSPDAATRLGWVAAPEDAVAGAAAMTDLVAALDAEGVTDVVLVGMGGSSLYAEVLERIIGPAAGAPRLWVLDSTDPAAVLRLERELPWTSTLLVPASKSGTTIEVRLLLDRLAARLVDAHGDLAGHWIVPITDPGTPLDAEARERGHRTVVHGRADVGGRFSALSPFGLLPAVLLGIDPVAHVAPARARLAGLAAAPDEAATLAAFLAAAVDQGRDKVAIVLSPEARPFGAWLEQLVAESLGKGGRGPLPVLGEDPGRIRGADRALVTVGAVPGADVTAEAGVPHLALDWPGARDVAAAVVTWEVAVAVAGELLGIDPFDQPDVAAAKAATARVLDAGEDVVLGGDPEALVRGLALGSYLAVLAYVDPQGEDAAALTALVARLRARLAVPVTLGIGPRYLHSTGQAHKGGAPDGAFLVVVGDDPEDAMVPGSGLGLSRVKRAQAAGDAATLAGLGRPVVVARPRDVLALA